MSDELEFHGDVKWDGEWDMHTINFCLKNDKDRFKNWLGDISYDNDYKQFAIGFIDYVVFTNRQLKQIIEIVEKLNDKMKENE